MSLTIQFPVYYTFPMKQLAIRSIKEKSMQDAASLVMSTVPAIMRAFRKEMREHRPAELSVPQFRTLIFVDRRNDTSISDVADHLGLALSTTSKLIDGLLKRHYIERAVAADDRRRAIVTLTPQGKNVLDTTRAQTHARMAQCLATPAAHVDRGACNRVMHGVDDVV